MGQRGRRGRDPLPLHLQLVARVPRHGRVRAQPLVRGTHDAAGELSVGDVREITMRWREQLLFEGGAPGRPLVVVDGDGAAATSPVELLLLAAATCSAADVVVILRKQRVGLRSLDVLVRGTRREMEPRRYTALHMVFTVSGEGRSEEHTSELQSLAYLVCRLLLEKKKI